MTAITDICCRDCVEHKDTLLLFLPSLVTAILTAGLAYSFANMQDRKKGKALKDALREEINQRKQQLLQTQEALKSSTGERPLHIDDLLLKIKYQLKFFGTQSDATIRSLSPSELKGVIVLSQQLEMIDTALAQIEEHKKRAYDLHPDPSEPPPIRETGYQASLRYTYLKKWLPSLREQLVQTVAYFVSRPNPLR